MPLVKRISANAEIAQMIASIGWAGIRLSGPDPVRARELAPVLPEAGTKFTFVDTWPPVPSPATVVVVEAVELSPPTACAGEVVVVDVPVVEVEPPDGVVPPVPSPPPTAATVAVGVGVSGVVVVVAAGVTGVVVGMVVVAAAVAVSVGRGATVAASVAVDVAVAGVVAVAPAVAAPPGTVGSPLISAQTISVPSSVGER